MRYGRFALAGVLAGAMAFMSPALAPVAAQAPKAPAKAPAAKAPEAPKAPAVAYVAPKTPWGDPDLQGVYDYQSMIPMQRPRELAGKTTFTDAELAEWAKGHTPNQDQCGYGTKADQACTVQQLDNVGGYNEFWDNRKIVKDNRTALIENPPDGRIPPMTPEGVQRMADYRKIHPTNADEGAGGNVTVRSWDDFPGITRCIAEQTPNGVQMYNSGTYVMQSPGWVTIVRERLDTRVIPLDGRPHIGDNIRQWNGDSRGHFEGSTLVVDTTNFTDRQAAGGVGATVPAGVPFGNIHVIERFVPISKNRINYYATVEDPHTWTQPWTFMLPWARDESYTIYEYACNEGNISVGNALKGTNYLDAAKKEVDPTTTGVLMGGTEASILAKFGEPAMKLGPRWEYEDVIGNPVYVYFVDGKVTSVRPNDLPLDRVKKR